MNYLLRFLYQVWVNILHGEKRGEGRRQLGGVWQREVVSHIGCYREGNLSVGLYQSIFTCSNTPGRVDGEQIGPQGRGTRGSSLAEGGKGEKGSERKGWEGEELQREMRTKN